MSDLGLSISVKATNVDVVRANLKKIQIRVEDLEQPVREVGAIGLALTRSYPPYGDWRSGKISFVDIRPGTVTNYVRTKVLQKGWKGQLRKGSKVLYTYRLYNYTTIEAKRNRPYLKYVQGDEQAKMHVGIWYNHEEMSDMLNEEAIKILERFVKSSLR